LKIILFIFLPILLLAQYNPVGDNTIILLRGDEGVTVSSGKVSEWMSQDATGTREAIPDNPPDPVNDGPTYANNELTFVSASTQFLGIINADLPHWGTSDFTISVRFKKTTLATFDCLVSIGSSAATNEFVFGFWNSNNKIEFNYNSVTFEHSTATVLNTDYYVYTIVRSGNNAIMYINGADAQTSSNYLANLNITSSGDDLSIGARNNGVDQHFEGIISDVKIDTVAISQADIQAYIAWIDGGRVSDTNKGFKKFSKFPVYKK